MEEKKKRQQTERTRFHTFKQSGGSVPPPGTGAVPRGAGATTRGYTSGTVFGRPLGRRRGRAGRKWAKVSLQAAHRSPPTSPGSLSAALLSVLLCLIFPTAARLEVYLGRE